MQYVTTRSNEKTFDWLHALTDDRAEDGGFYIPAEPICFTTEEISALAMKNPNQAVAEILNLLFGCKLSRWDVDFAVGRYPVRLSTMVRRIAIAESWHNVDWEFERTIRELFARVRGSRDSSKAASNWFRIAVRIGYLFGIFGELMRDGISAADRKVDVVVPSADLNAAMAVWYARSWGLPVGNLIICCNENNNLWNLIRQGEIRTGTAVRETATPQCDHAWPENLERLVHGCGGDQQVCEFAKAAEEGKSYFPDAGTLLRLQEGIYVSVIGQERLEATIPTIYKNHNYVFGPYSALCYAGLTDFRSRTGSADYALILSERGALRDDSFVARELNMAVSTLHHIL